MTLEELERKGGGGGREKKSRFRPPTTEFFSPASSVRVGKKLDHS